MSNLTDVYLPDAFHYKKDIKTNSTHFVHLSQLDIRALQRYFN